MGCRTDKSLHTFDFYVDRKSIEQVEATIQAEHANPYQQHANIERHATAMLALLKRQRTRPPLYFTCPVSVDYTIADDEGISVEVIKRARETPITITHITSIDEFRRAMREPTHA